MATLAETLEALTAEHDLTAMSVHIHHYESGGVRYRSWSANAHWSNAGGRCASANGDTPEEAMARAIAEANAIRGRGIDVPETIEMGEVL